MRLKDRIAFVTAGGGDIGTASARALAREGAKVAVTDIREDAARATAASIVDEGGTARAYGLDVLDEASVDTTLEAVTEEWGCPTVVFNLAGDTVIKKTLDMSVEEFDRIMRLNVTSQFIVSKAAARRMIERGTGGSIINVASILGYGGTPRRAGYTASRAAVMNLTRTLAVEWALDGIRVNCVAPGWTWTPNLAMAVEQGSLNVDALVERTPMGRLPGVDDVANAVVFLASDESAMVTGHSIPVDGGVVAFMGVGNVKPSLV
jgi:NAD(P)-dependent dehydrogenase (short-subunit alcohol dehydrogenase family)